MSQEKENRDTVIRLLDKFEITYWTEGNNVVEGSVGINCIFCGDDPSNHLGIIPEFMTYSCWRCHETGGFAYLLSKLADITYQESKELIGLGDLSFDDVEGQIEKSFFQERKERYSGTLREIPMPEYFEPLPLKSGCKMLEEYLERRRYTMEFVQSQGCGICRVGEYMGRMIVPVEMGGKIVAYQAADMSGRAIVKYQSDNFKQIKKTLYRYDSIEVGGWMILTEGVLDAWRTGENASCSFSTTVTDEQKKLILNKRLSRLSIFFDDDAYWWSKELAKYFSPHIDRVDVIKCPTGKDPDKLEKHEIDSLLETC